MRDHRRLYLFCVAEKYTAKPLTETAEVWAYSPQALPSIARDKWNITVDGVNTFIDWTDVTPED